MKDQQESLDQKLHSILQTALLHGVDEPWPCEQTIKEAITAIKQAVVEELPNPWTNDLEDYDAGFNDCLSEIKLKLGLKV